MEEENSDDILYICRAARCKKNNADELVRVLEKVLQTSIDAPKESDLIKLETILCLGQCPHGPNIKANNKIYTHVDKQILKRVLVAMKARLINKN